MRFSTRAKIVVMLLYHRAQSNWNSDKKARTLVYGTREGREKEIFLTAGKSSLKKLEKLKTAKS